MYVGTTNGTMHALYADDLTEIWSLPVGGPITSSPAIGDPHIIGDPNPAIIVPGGDGNVYALDEVNDQPVRCGQRQWARRSARPSARGQASSTSAPTTRGSAPDAATGRELFTSDEITCSRSSPIVADGTVLVGTTHAELVAFWSGTAMNGTHALMPAAHLIPDTISAPAPSGVGRCRPNHPARHRHTSPERSER